MSPIRYKATFVCPARGAVCRRAPSSDPLRRRPRLKRRPEIALDSYAKARLRKGEQRLDELVAITNATRRYVKDHPDLVR